MFYARGTVTVHRKPETPDEADTLREWTPPELLSRYIWGYVLSRHVLKKDHSLGRYKYSTYAARSD